MEKHVDVLGILFIVYGIFNSLIGLMILALYMGMGAVMGIAGGSSGDEEMIVIGGIMGVVGLLTGCLVLVFSLPGIVAGLGLRRRAGWARIVAIVVGAMSIMSIPFGTALGIYALVVLLDKEVGEAFQAANA